MCCTLDMFRKMTQSIINTTPIKEHNELISYAQCTCWAETINQNSVNLIHIQLMWFVTIGIVKTNMPRSVFLTKSRIAPRMLLVSLVTPWVTPGLGCATDSNTGPGAEERGCVYQAATVTSQPIRERPGDPSANKGSVAQWHSHHRSWAATSVMPPAPASCRMIPILFEMSAFWFCLCSMELNASFWKQLLPFS